MSTAASLDAWSDLTLSQLKTELEKRNASTQTATPKAQLVQRLLRIEAGNPLDDDMARKTGESAGVGGRKDNLDGGENEDEEEFRLVAEDEAALVSAVKTEGGKGDDDLEEDFGIDSGDEAELEALAVEVESPNLKRTRQSQEGNGSDAKRQCVEADNPPSAYPATSQIAVNTLKSCFGLQQFRLKQEAAIARILAGGNAVVVFPTGGGKSLCYQVPAFAFAELDRQTKGRGGGITLVVSPLIALMKDQVDALRRKGLAAACLDSTKSREEYLETMESMRNGTLKLLYCAPERLNNEGFVASMQSTLVRLVAVDEAHCISEWGHAFRPDYLKVARFVKEIRAERVVCLTATATKKVAQDICDAFNVDDSGLFRTTTYRPNLRLHVKSAATKEMVYPGLFKLLRDRPGSTIIYITTQSQTEDLALKLRSEKFNAKAFHAGMESSLKSLLQDEFMASPNMIMVATIAFGMGVDKANIRNVIHFDIPRSLEGYSQEIGRAGRDGAESLCQLYLCGEDLHLKESNARADLPSKESVRALLRDIFDAESASLRPGESIERKLFQQSRDFDIRPTTLGTIYAQLELRFKLIRASTPRYEGYSYTIHAPARIQRDGTRAALAVRAASKTAKKWTSIDVDSAARDHNLTRFDIISKLNEWGASGAIELKTSGVISVYRVLQALPSTPRDVDRIVDALYVELEAREQQELDRVQDVIRLVTGRRCFALSLVSHFGDALPNGRTECGHCTWCETHEAVELSTQREVPWDAKRFQAVLAAVDARDDARFLARVAFGITSPRVSALKLGHGAKTVFGSMGDHEFVKLLNAFTKACSDAIQRGQSSGSRGGRR